MVKPVIWTYRKQSVLLFPCTGSYHCFCRNDVQHNVRSNSSCLIVIRRGPSDSHWSFPTINPEWVQEGHWALAETLHLIFVAVVFFSILQRQLVKTENFYFADWWKLGNILLSIIYHSLVLLVQWAASSFSLFLFFSGASFECFQLLLPRHYQRAYWFFFRTNRFFVFLFFQLKWSLRSGAYLFS